jgi:hypothetical protein
MHHPRSWKSVPASIVADGSRVVVDNLTQPHVRISLVPLDFVVKSQHMPKRCGNSYASMVFGHSCLSGSGRARNFVGDPSNKSCRGFKPSGRLPGSRRSIVAWSRGGSALWPALRHCWQSPQSTCRSIG